MRRVGGILIAAVLALAGCKSTDSKAGDDKSSTGVAGRTRNKDREQEGSLAKGPAWLNDMARLPGAGTSVPKASGPTNPKDANFDAKTAAQSVLAGRVLDPDGKPARNVFIRIEEVGALPASGAAGKGIYQGIYTNNDGHFSNFSLRPGVTYDLIAEATTKDGKQLTAVAQTKVPNPTLLIVLRDDLPPQGGGFPAPKWPDGGTFPPTPKPSDRVGEAGPPMGSVPAVPKAPPADGAWVPGGSVTGVPPPTLNGTPKPPGGSGGAIPPPDDLNFPSTRPPVKPENVADGPKDPFKPPAVNIPGMGGPPPVPPLPTLPPSFPPPGGGGRSSMAQPLGGAPRKLALVDVLDRPWSLDSVAPGELVLVEFATSTCLACKQAVPILKDLQSRYGASGLQVATVICDNLPQQDRAVVAAKYGRDQNVNYAMYVEPGTAGGVRDRFGVENYPTAVLLDSAGRVLWQGHPGYKDKLEAAIKQNLGK